MMRCEEAIERLPWWLSSSLPEDEHQEVEAHLEGCSRCRRELELVREASSLYAGHIPVRDLADYGLGRKVYGISREILELHLADCASCRDELELVAQDEGSFRSALRTSSKRWRHLAVAASLVATIGISGLVWQGRRSPSPRANVALVELLPDSFTTRGEGPEPEILEPWAHPVVLVLVTDRAESFADARLRVIGGSDRAIWEVGGLERSADGDYSVLVPEHAFPDGEVSLHLEGLGDDGWTTIETYHLTVRPGPG